MRKQQQKILEMAKKHEDFSNSQIDVLSREDVSIQILELAFRYFQTQNKHEFNKDETVAEVNKWIDFLIKKKNEGKIANTEEMLRLANDLLPNYCSNDKDTLLGNTNKMKAYSSYKIAKYYEQKAKDQDWYVSAVHLQTLYVKLLYHGLEYKDMRILLKKQISPNRAVSYSCWQTRRLLNTYSCLMDDYTHNKESSLLLWLIENEKDGKFDPTPEVLDNLYDYDNHKFIFPIDKFHLYFKTTYSYNGEYRFVENKSAIAELRKDEYPIIEYLANYCNSKKMKKDCDYDSSDIFAKWHECKLNDSSLQKKFKECYAVLNRNFSVDATSWKLAVSTNQRFFANITYSEHNRAIVYSQKGEWATEGNGYQITITIAPDGKMFKRTGTQNEKLIPLSIKDFLRLLNKQNGIGKLMDAILDFHQSRSPFFKDVIDDCKDSICLLPLNFNDVLDHYNRAHYLKSKYKLANNLKVNWNKQNLNLSYLIIKAYTWMEPGISQQIILQQKDMKLLPDASYKHSVEEKTIDFITNVIYENLIAAEIREKDKKDGEIKRKYQQEIDDEVQTTILEDELGTWLDDRVADEFDIVNTRRVIHDYVRMCRQTKRKIRIDVKSVRQIENLHNFAANGNGYYRTNTSQVKVPKKSKFNKLREILPEEFEWIKTRKRLVLETELQHHCVWSYADKITADRCAIYSFVDSEGKYAEDGKAKRYTIEFMLDRKGKYVIEQVQGKYDRVHTKKMKEYIQEILDEEQKKRREE